MPPVIMWFLGIFFSFTILNRAVFASPASRHVLHERRTLDNRWKRQRKLPSDTILPMRIGLSQQNLHRANEYLYQVSHPASADYGKHWTAEQVSNAFSASDETVNAVKEWLAQNNISPARLSHHHNDWIEANVTAQEAERLLRTEYFVHENQESGNLKVACEEYWIPQNIREHIDFITPTVHLDTITKKRRAKRQEAHPATEKRAYHFWYPEITPCPTCAPGQNPGDPKTYIGNCNNSTTPACVRALYGLPDPSAVKPFVGGRAPLGALELYPAAYGAVDLDDFLVVLTNVPHGTQPRVVSIAGGVAPAAVPGLHDPTPFDPSTLWEPDGDFEIAMAIVPNPEDVVVYELGKDADWNTFLDALDGSYCTTPGDGNCGSIQGADLANVISISWTSGETGASAAYFQRQCNEYMKLGLMGITVLAATGDSGVGAVCTDPSTGKGYTDSKQTGGLFTANFPASCPYVTAVGATAIPKTPPFTPGMLEVAAYSAINSGGGFSNIFPAADYQKPTMATYNSTNAPNYLPFEDKPRYNNSGLARGYPDISANGYQYSIYSNENSNLFSGTSGSTPMIAGIIALINDERMAAKDAAGKPVKGSVGFINPVLYEHPEMVNDIVTGSNPGCGTVGFSCSKGWDPVTGLGTPDYQKMSAVWNSLP